MPQLKKTLCLQMFLGIGCWVLGAVGFAAWWFCGVIVAPKLLCISPGACIIKLITAVIYSFRNKLECLYLASLSSLVKCLGENTS
jgi:hypothetical protein